MAGKLLPSTFGRWHPLETAPQDGTPVLLFTQWHDRVVGHWSPERCVWIDVSHGIVVAVCWMPLPDPPEIEVEDDTEVSSSPDRVSSHPGILVAG
jgi:hypothetical protein